MSPPQWNSSASSTSFTLANHADPSRLPYDPRDSADHAWNLRPLQYTGLAGSSSAWPAHHRSPSRLTEGYPRVHPVDGTTMAATNYDGAPAFAAAETSTKPPSMVSSVHMQQRRASDEEWQRHQLEPHIPRIKHAPLTASSFHDPAWKHREIVLSTTSAKATPSDSAAASPDADPPRARVACSFCRVRKLRCDGATPCRHCERRDMDCVYAPVKTKAKPSGRTSSGPGRHPNETGQSGSSHDRGTKRSVLPNATHNRQTPSFTKSDTSSEYSKRVKLAGGSLRRTSSGESSDLSCDSSLQSLSTPSSSMPGSDLAMIQNNNIQIPMEPTFGNQDEWWNDLLGIFGRPRLRSMRVIQHLLTRFVQSNAVFFGLLHAPTLLEVVSGNRGHTRAEPALYLAVLAVSVCDMHQTRIADERTSDMRSASEASRRLALQLSTMAASYLQTSLSSGTSLTPSVGQAASILALTQPDGSSQQNDLIRLAENVVRTLKLHETISSREALLEDSEPESPLYWSRPLTSSSPESEVKYESIVRLCWTGISHRFRKYIAEPDQGFGDIDLPEFIQGLRPMAFWQPSLLPEDLPPPFFHSQDLMRRSARLSRLAVSLAQLEKIKQVDRTEPGDAPSQETLEQVHEILQALDQLERSFVRHRPRSDAERQSVLGRTLQMFCRMHVWMRLTVWRKYNLWNQPISSSEKAESGQLLLQQHHPTVEFWLTIVHEMVGRMQDDMNAHVVDGTALKTSVSDVDSLVRHAICACDLVVATQKREPIVGLVDAALNALKRILAHAELNVGVRDALSVPEDVRAKIGKAEARRVALEEVDHAREHTKVMLATPKSVGFNWRI